MILSYYTDNFGLLVLFNTVSSPFFTTYFLDFGQSNLNITFRIINFGSSLCMGIVENTVKKGE